MQRSFAQMARIFYQDEVNDHLTYTILAEATPDTSLQQHMARIAAMERTHADFWQHWLISHDEPLPPAGVHKGRLACLRLAQRLLNPLALVGLLEMGETASLKRYQTFLSEAPLAESEEKHLQGIVLDELEHETFFKQMGQTLGVTHLRDFVLGMNDGLVEILGTVAGLSAVYTGKPLLVAVSGLIVGIAGALSMGIGAFISVRSQRQVNEGTRERMEMLFTIAPERAMQAYQDKLVESGIPEALATEITDKLGANKQALMQLVLEESDDNEVRSGLFTGGAYLIGVVFPILPYFLVASSRLALPLAVVSAGGVLALVSLVVALLSGMSIKAKIGEMLIAGFAAAGLSYAFGNIVQSVFGIEAGM